jgi:hypothetical protein
LLDGQHRTRAFVKVKTWLFTGKLQKQIDLSNIITNIEIHAKTGNGARQIYTNIDKNMKLNQAQVQQLSHSVESQITNYLNQSDDSKMKGKIATSRPVGKKLCLFNTITDVLKKYGNIESDEVAQYKEYLKNFFNYLVTVLPDAFGKDEDKRVEFRKDNLINENNMFKAWVRLALADKEHFKENIDKVIANVDYYKKDNKVWLDGTTTKVRKKKDAQTGEKVPCGFSMNNTSTAFETLYDETFKIAGIEK